MNLVYFTITRYYPHHKGDDDIAQIGMLGLCKAATSYDESKGQFSTYAVFKIRGAISTELRRDNRRIKTVSLDAERETDDGSVAIHNVIMGDVDEGYVDMQPLYKVLTPHQRAVFDLLQQGMSRQYICRVLGISRQGVHSHIRLIQKKWRKVMGE